MHSLPRRLALRLQVATNGGGVFCYLMSIPVLSACHHNRLVYLSSLRNVTVVDTSGESPACESRATR